MSLHLRVSHLVVVILLAVILFAFWPAEAQVDAPPPAVKIGVIDTEKVLMASAFGKAAMAELKTMQDDEGKKLAIKQQAVKDLQAKLEAAKGKASADEMTKQAKALDEAMASLQRDHAEATSAIERKRDLALATLDQKVMPAINQIGKEWGYTVIFRKFESGLIYADDRVDLTNKVIQALDDAGKK